MKKNLDLSQMLKLSSVGIDVYIKNSEIQTFYSNHERDTYRIFHTYPLSDKDIRAFDLQDLFNFLPSIIKNYQLVVFEGRGVAYQHFYNDSSLHIEDRLSLLESCYEMLFWLAKSGYIGYIKEINL